MFAIATDLVFTHFICPAIVNPEPYGITDAPISYIARFNLIQVAQILQMLAMRRYEGVDPKVEDLYSQFDKVGITRLKIYEKVFKKLYSNLFTQLTVSKNISDLKTTIVL